MESGPIHCLPRQSMIKRAVVCEICFSHDSTLFNMALRKMEIANPLFEIYQQYFVDKARNELRKLYLLHVALEHKSPIL